jgi:DNA-binding NarL/FixJ family response regulator
MKKVMVRIVIAAEDEVVRKCFADDLQRRQEFEIAGQVRDGYDVIRLTNAIHPEIALVDERLPLLNGAEMTATLNLRSPETKVIILTNNPAGPLVLDAINNGAAGYIMKNALPSQVVAGVNYVLEGGSLMNRDIADKAFKKHSTRLHSKEMATMKKISLQQLRLITFVGQGFSNKEIADVLKLKCGTIRNYVSAVLQKTGMRNRAEIAVFAYSLGLIQDKEQ